LTVEDTTRIVGSDEVPMLERLIDARCNTGDTNDYSRRREKTVGRTSVKTIRALLLGCGLALWTAGCRWGVPNSPSKVVVVRQKLLAVVTCHHECRE
jgi:hypothetical protein